MQELEMAFLESHDAQTHDQGRVSENKAHRPPDPQISSLTIILQGFWKVSISKALKFSRPV